jgi:hypothetical protein
MATNKEMRQLVKDAVRAGCEAVRLRNGHTKLIAPNGVRLDISFSPGSNQAVREQQFRVRKFLAVNCKAAS